MKRKARNVAGWCLLIISGGSLAWGWTTAVQQTNRVRFELQVMHDFLESSDYAMAVLDSDGRAKIWNKAIEKLTGYPRSEMIGQRIEWIMIPEMAMQHRRAVQKAMADPRSRKEVRRVECNMLNRQGEPIPVVISVRVVSPLDGDPYSIAHVDRQSRIIDIPQTKQPEL